ncbi:MAG: reverse transcriptase family protein [Muribaculaceae bacterium]|nr:reverse transcriptase family protein [Muribaculaceae bacterium]
MDEDFSAYFKDTSFATVEELTDALNHIAPYTGAWGILEPVSPDTLRHFRPAWIRASAYTDFLIPKKAGGFRKISAPGNPLKEILSTLNVLLQAVFTPSEHAFGFVRNLNVRDNAAVHTGQTCVFNLDLEDFFPSITKSMLGEALRNELSDRFTSDEVIHIICSLCTVPVKKPTDGPRDSLTEALPQGAPTSPVLSNIVLKRLDGELGALAAKAGFRYSRYADDITFSHSNPVRRIEPHWRERIESIITTYGLTINEKKTRTLTPGKRMEVTGLTVNIKPNVARRYAKQIRTLLHLWEKYGYMEAQAIFARDFEPGTEKQLKRVIYGKINYLEMVKGNGDPTYLRLRSRYRKLAFSGRRTENINPIRK